MQDEIFSPASIPGKLSLDRCTFLLYSPRLSLWSADNAEYRENERRIERMATLTENVLKNELDPDFPQGHPSQLFLKHYRTTDEVDIQFGAVMPKRKKITDEDAIQMFGTPEEKEQGFKWEYSPNNFAFRVEYNPNNTNLDAVSPLLKNFSHYSSALDLIRIARLDIAIDFQASLVPELVLCQGMRKSFTASGDHGLETIYFGSRQSKNWIRLYDKRQERKDKAGIDIGYNLWRLELESKESFYLSDVPDHGKVFQRLTFYDGAVSMQKTDENGIPTGNGWILDLIRSQAMQYGLKNVLGKMPRKTAYRYGKLFKSLVDRQGVETPSDIYYREFPYQMKRLRCEILTACGYHVALN